MLSYDELLHIQEPLLEFAAITEAALHYFRGLRQWRALTADWWVRLQLISWKKRPEISAKFLEFYRLVYGQRALSSDALQFYPHLARARSCYLHRADQAQANSFTST